MRKPASGQHAVVVGGGFGGLGAAARLRARGYQVTLVDKQDKLGGRGYVYHRNGYVFDAGPTVVTAPFLIDELFELFGKQRADYIDFRPVYPWYRIVFADGTHFDYGGTLEQTLDQIRRIEPADADGYLRMLEHSRRIFDVGFTELGDKPFPTIWSMLKVAPDLMRLGNWRTVWQMACKYIRNDKLRRVFSFQPLLVGGNPFNTTCIYSLIQYLEREWGVHFAMGGTGRIISGIEKLLVEEGVQVRLGAEVARLDVRAWEELSLDERGEEDDADRYNGAVRGVVLASGERIPADLVVCNADAPAVHRHLIDPKFRTVHTNRRLERMKYSMGLFVLYFGTTRQYPDVAHHTIILGEKYGKLLHEMFDLKQLEMEDLSVYLHRPTATDPSMAPAGCDCWYVLVPVPNLQGGQDWSEVGPRYRDVVVDYLERKAIPGLRECITEDFYVTPKHFEVNLNTLYGSGFSIQPTFTQSAYFRFHNKSREIADLYFVGAGTHPGAGMPGTLCSAKVLEYVLPEPMPLPEKLADITAG